MEKNQTNATNVTTYLHKKTIFRQHLKFLASLSPKSNFISWETFSHTLFSLPRVVHHHHFAFQGVLWICFAIYLCEFIHLFGHAWPLYITDPLFIRPYRVSINWSPSIKSNDCHRRGGGLIFHADHYLKLSQSVKQLSQDYIYTFISNLVKFSYLSLLMRWCSLIIRCIMLEVYDDELDCKYNIMMEIWIDAYNRNSLLMDMTMMMRKTMTMMTMMILWRNSVLMVADELREICLPGLSATMKLPIGEFMMMEIMMIVIIMMMKIMMVEHDARNVCQPW